MRSLAAEQPLDPAGRRAFGRRQFEVRVDLLSEDTFFTGFTENISEGGLFFVTEAPFEIGDELSIRLTLMGKEPDEYKVIVRWIRPVGSLGGLPAGMGVQFLDLPENHRMRLQEFIDSGVKDTLFIDLD